MDEPTFVVFDDDKGLFLINNQKDPMLPNLFKNDSGQRVAPALVSHNVKSRLDLMTLGKEGATIMHAQLNAWQHCFFIVERCENIASEILRLREVNEILEVRVVEAHEHSRSQDHSRLQVEATNDELQLNITYLQSQLMRMEHESELSATRLKDQLNSATTVNIDLSAKLKVLESHDMSRIAELDSLKSSMQSIKTMEKFFDEAHKSEAFKEALKDVFNKCECYALSILADRGVIPQELRDHDHYLSLERRENISKESEKGDSSENPK